MPTWNEYKDIAKSRGSLAMELFVVESTAETTSEEMQAVLPDHLAYQKDVEAQGKLFLAGPLSDASGELMEGTGMIVYRVGTIEEALKLADADPMHAKGVRSYKIRKWLINEGAISLSVTLSRQHISIA